MKIILFALLALLGVTIAQRWNNNCEFCVSICKALEVPAVVSTKEDVRDCLLYRCAPLCDNTKRSSLSDQELFPVHSFRVGEVRQRTTRLEVLVSRPDPIEQWIPFAKAETDWLPDTYLLQRRFVVENNRLAEAVQILVAHGYSRKSKL